jgi:hypothetical protein
MGPQEVLLQRRKMRDRITAMLGIRATARRLFMDGDGEFTADAVQFFGLLADHARMGDGKMAATEREETWRAAQRGLVLYALSLADLDEGRLLHLKRQMQDLEEYDDE